MRVLDLFSGIGGFSLGLERAGMTTAAFCEISPKCRHLLATHWPKVRCFEDVTTLTGDQVGPVDVICGGFPCQDISFAGKGAGLAGERSGLWRHYARLIGELRPKYVIVENVSALLGRGLGDVLGDMAAFRYDAWWDCIPSSAIGTPHRRDRIFIVAWLRDEEDDGFGDRLSAAVKKWIRITASEQGLHLGHDDQAQPQHSDTHGFGSHSAGMHLDGGAELRDEQVGLFEPLGVQVANPMCNDAQGVVASLADQEERQGQVQRPAGSRHAGERGKWAAEPDVGRVAHGVPARVDRLHGLGNAVVPQIPELIGRAIMEARAP